MFFYTISYASLSIQKQMIFTYLVLFFLFLLKNLIIFYFYKSKKNILQPNSMQQKSQETLNLRMKGTIYAYDITNKLVAFTNDIGSQTVVILIGGLGASLLSTPFTVELVDFCNQKKVRIIIPQRRSMPNYRIFSIFNDIDDLLKIIESNQGKQIILIGHSTGCQISMLYLKKHGVQNISKVFLLAPVSDVEYQQKVNSNLKKQIEFAKTNKFFVPVSDNQIWLSQRFLSLNERFGVQDWFSSYLPEEHYKSWKSYGIPIVSIVCQKDIYGNLKNNDNLKLGSQLYVIEGASHSLHQQSSRIQFFKILSNYI